jgi:hypothetical protein
MISETKKHNKVQLTTDIADQIALVLRGIRFGSVVVSYTTAKLCKSNAERSYALTQNKHLTKWINSLYRKNGEINYFQEDDRQTGSPDGTGTNKDFIKIR